MRQRERLLQSLESMFREAYRAAQELDDAEEMTRLDFEYQREQIHLEVQKAQAIKQLTKLR